MGKKKKEKKPASTGHTTQSPKDSSKSCIESKKDPHIALLMMVKNEEKRILVSLESVIGTVKSIIIYDTGSQDKTIEIIKEFCEKHSLPFRLKQGIFENFCVSRNVSLDFADTFEDVEYLLLLDCNDELRGGEHLKKVAISEKATPISAYLLNQQWWSGTFDQYYNIRFVKARRGWRYMGSVHEYISQNAEWKEKEKVMNGGTEPLVIRLPDMIALYQDRTKDDDKSLKRFSRDKELLLKDYKKDPTEPRTLFYLAQTCACLSHVEDAYYYYKLRITVEGFQEEKFHAYLRLGDLATSMGHDWSDVMGWYMKAFEHTARVEPLLRIAEYYRNKKAWVLSYTFVKLGCRLSYPVDCILFVDRKCYDYQRWHLMGIIAYYYAGVCESNEQLIIICEGKIACEKAIENAKSNKREYTLDESNLKFYVDKEKELLSKNVQPPCVRTKKEFIAQKVEELKQLYPKMGVKQLELRAKEEWKKM